MPTVTTGISKLLDFELKSNKAVANGYCDLDAAVKVPLARLYSGSGAGLDADTVDTKHAADFLLLTGDTMIGNIDFSGAQLHMNDNYISCGYQTGIQAIGGGVPRDLTFYDSAYPAGKTLSDLVGGAGGPYLPLAGGTLTGDLLLDKVTPLLGFKEGGLNKGALLWIGGMVLDCYSGAIYITTTTAASSIFFSTNNISRLFIEDTGITAVVPLAMGGTNKITGLAAGTVAGDALRYEQLVGAYLPLAAGSGSKLTGDLWINKTDPSLVFQDAVNTIGYLNCFSAGGITLQSNIGNINLTSVDTTKSISCVIGAVNKFKVEDTLITSVVDHLIKKDNGAINFKDAAAINRGSIYGFATKFEIKGSGDLALSSGSAITNLLLQISGITRLTLGYYVLTSAVPLAMGGTNKITGLAAGTVAGDALRYEQLVGAYLPLAAGSGSKLTGDLWINKTDPSLVFQDAVNTIGYLNCFSAGGITLQSNIGNINLTSVDTTKSISCVIGAVNKFKVENALITAAVALAMGGTNKITGLAAGTVAGDALRYEQLVGAYLPLAAGSGSKLTGDLWINKTDPSLVFQDAVNTIGYLNCFSAGGITLQSNIGNINLTSVDTTKSISCVIGAVNKFKVENTVITAAVPIAMGTNKITGLAAATVAGDAVRFEQLTSGSADIKQNLGPWIETHKHLVTSWTAGTDIYHSHDVERYITIGTTYTTLKTITLAFVPNSTLRIYYEYRAAYQSYWNIFRNGVAVGTEKTYLGSTYQVWTENIAGWADGDILTLKGKSASGTTNIYVRNLRILTTASIIMNS